MAHQASPDDRFQLIRSRLAGCDQLHLLAFWPELSPQQRCELLDDIAQINLAEIPSLVRTVRAGPGHSTATARIEPPQVLPRSAAIASIEGGREMLREGRVAALTVAGGQGTRLGFAGPKGAFEISPLRRKPLFQLFAEALLATSRRSGRNCHWYIMTSPANHEATRDFFQAHKFFGLPVEGVIFFEQGVMPAFDPEGRILLDRKHRVALSPDGHGGSLLALASRGVLADMAARGIDTISYFQVDNPLVHPLDPAFLGLHDARGSEMSSKTLSKADDLERVGNFALCDGRLTVIEYSDLPIDLARARNPDGSRRFDAANIAIHALSRTFVERLTADRAAFALPWHRAEKKVPCVDPATGRRIEPDRPNAVKLEAFVFDALPLARNPIVVGTDRGEEFSPVKNADGVDSVATAQRDMSRRAARWIEAAGVPVARDGAGEPPEPFEISPLYAMDREELAAKGPNRIAADLKAGNNYLG